jgi:flagellum-specific peptidoglycan hydrolase FlgJ
MRVPHADIIVAQALLESQNFNSNLFKRQNNFLGMKISSQRISTTGQGKGEYKDYTNWQECTTDYIFWMHHYQAHKLNRDEYFKLLGKIYAEDPEYVNKLKGIIKQFKFK